MKAVEEHFLLQRGRDVRHLVKSHRRQRQILLMQIAAKTKQLYGLKIEFIHFARLSTNTVGDKFIRDLINDDDRQGGLNVGK